MFNDIAKLAAAIALLVVLTSAGIQNHWFSQGGAALSELMAPRGDAQAAANEEGANPVAAPAPHSSWGVVELQPVQNSHYLADVEISGSHISGLVDTGASFLSLTAEDARTLDIDPPQKDFNVKVSTANGTIMDAHVRLPEVRVGSIVVYNVDALVAPPGAQNVTLLGMSFLKKLSSFAVADGRFVMKQ